ncbi:hypothetical protein E2562_011764 [Oryza meyeriana var. granulata]|uniref:Uncharacterized protein n=1 Tax=Oryza meyeriana var. granulata TaxID=110450 RepID=A0A6G1CMQ6_9ORYZ|nr:hypothetical protein E2562_011764 [Oryza meyeriana var. granulata]
MACVVATSTSQSTRHCHWSARRSRRRPRGVHRPVEEVEDGGRVLKEVEAATSLMAGEAPVAVEAAARVVGETEVREDGAMALGEVETAAAHAAAEAMVMNWRRSGHGWSRY